MLSPGFIIRNDTIWPLQISLNQISPLYFDVIQPGQSFIRETGAVWFTIKAALFLDEKSRITNWDAVWPIATVAGAVLVTAVTAGAAAYAAGPALAVTSMAGISGVTGLSSASMLATATAASALAGAGIPAGASLVIGGAVVGGVGTAITSIAGEKAIKQIFTPENASVSKAGCYAGPPWPFRKDLGTYRVTGGPTFRTLNDQQVEAVGAPLTIQDP